MKTPTKEQVKYITEYISWILGKQVSYQMAFNILEEYERIRED